MSNLWDLEHLQPDHRIAVAGDTLASMFWHAAQARKDKVWMRQKELGLWRSWTWAQTAEAVREIANGMMSLGFAPHERASILSNTVIEWVLADLAILSCQGVSNGIYPTDAAEQVSYLCEDSESVILFVEDDEQLDKALEVRDHLPKLRHIVVFDMEGLRDMHDPRVISLEALREKVRNTQPNSTKGFRLAAPKSWPFWFTPPAPLASPKAPCTATRAWCIRCAATTP
jgi:long-chain acyl-CoA synthetase